MTDLHEFDLISGTLESADNPVNAVAGVAVDSPHPPRRQSFQKKIADLLGHGRHPIVVCWIVCRRACKHGVFGLSRVKMHMLSTIERRKSIAPALRSKFLYMF